MTQIKKSHSQIQLPIHSLTTQTNCANRHQGFHALGRHIGAKFMPIKGYILCMWFQHIPAHSPGLYIRIYMKGRETHSPITLIDSTPDIISFTLDTADFNAVTTFAYPSDNANRSSHKLIYFDFDKLVMYKHTLNINTSEAILVSLTNNNTFVLYDHSNLYNYEVNSDYMTFTRIAYNGPQLHSLTYNSHNQIYALFEDNKKHYVTELDIAGNIVTQSLLLQAADSYTIKRVTKKHDCIIYGYNTLKQQLIAYKDPIEDRFHTIDYKRPDNYSELSVYYLSTGQLHVVEVGDGFTTTTIPTPEGLTIAKSVRKTLNTPTRGALLHYATLGTYMPKEFYGSMDLQNIAWKGGSYRLVQNMIASRVASLIDNTSFAKMYYVKDPEGTISINYQNPYSGNMLLSCGSTAITTLYAAASILGMPIDLDTLECYWTNSWFQPQLYYTYFHNAGRYNNHFGKDQVLISLYREHEGNWVIPRPSEMCDNIQHCDTDALKIIYKNFYSKHMSSLNNIIDSAACAYVHHVCDIEQPEVCEEQLEIEGSANQLRYAIDTNMNTIGQLLETWNKAGDVEQDI